MITLVCFLPVHTHVGVLLASEVLRVLQDLGIKRLHVSQHVGAGHLLLLVAVHWREDVLLDACHYLHTAKRGLIPLCKLA